MKAFPLPVVSYVFVSFFSPFWGGVDFSSPLSVRKSR